MIDEENMTLESFIENAVGYFPESEKILVGTQSSSDNAYILTAFDRYTSAQLREKARAFIGGNAMSEEMQEQYGISGEVPAENLHFRIRVEGGLCHLSGLKRLYRIDQKHRIAVRKYRFNIFSAVSHLFLP